ncbi:UDP-N-acetylmuramoyl-L-alanine--D-glutamate ligase [Sphaerotilus sp.]|uniref:UDP-N-acetylmuramoyl-L-alanine--D-glutamate ligase n=1 Tax=Sphaerotilus sp. TaxID=2093942 RepID=UPI002ACEBE07|nr:UDP-N-acetylmuramoyl-L-alanine--D-glutamate ligase [Sphaerotilus sp.]MDZ7855141.1 UDP-N-acetylmuramoyl-L-alanine--D-glutamate ligase [Sphaerotilus sp.]
MNVLKDLSLLILGLGDSGLAMARWAQRCGAARIVVADTREAPPKAAALAAEVPGAEFHGGPLALSLLDGVALVLKSPGLSPLDPAIAPLLDAARARGTAVQGELSLFALALQDLQTAQGYAPKVIAITGTNGKTTTTSLTAQLVARAGLRVAMAGNIGPTLMDTLTAVLEAAVAAEDADATPLPEVWVLELSSFQLDGVTGFHPTAATVLNVTQDHLDWHGSMAAYAEAKSRLFGAGTVRVLNADDPLVEAMAPREATATVVRFGLDAPRRVGDWGLVVENGMAWLVRAQAADDTPVKVRRGAAAPPVETTLQRLMPADALRIRGRHNAANALAALALATAAGVPLAPMLHGLREYRGEPHRVEYLNTIDGVDAYDDSKGTNVGATVAALTGLGADRAPAKLVVILGGDGKGQDFAPLAGPVERHARAVALIGRDAAAIGRVLQDVAVPMQTFATLEDATRWCYTQARSGDAVLLSPACASLDMFRNYAHRAEVFIDTVQALAVGQGELGA